MLQHRAFPDLPRYGVRADYSRKSASTSASFAVMHSAAQMYGSAVLRPSDRLSNTIPLLGLAEEPSTRNPTGHAKRASRLHVEAEHRTTREARLWSTIAPPFLY